MTVAAPDLAPAGASGLLVRNGLLDVQSELLASDASSRRYYRLKGLDVLLMEDSQDPEGFASYIQLSAHINGLGLSAPRVIDADPSTGMALIEDFGDKTYAACLRDGHDEGELYRLAVEALLHLHHHRRGSEVSRARYTLDVYLDELDIFSDWFAPAVAPDNFDAARFKARFRSLWAEALVPVAERFDTLVLRDFHVDNLMLLEDREGAARCGLLDFQDGIVGPCEYDLVSLLQDARRDLSAGLEESLLAYYVANAPAYLGAEKEVRLRYALLGAQRHARILGVFVRLGKRDGKKRYLAFMPRVLRQLKTALDAASLNEISDFLSTELPGWQEGGILSGGAHTRNGVSDV